METQEVVTKTEEANNEKAIIAFNAALSYEKADTVILCDCSSSMWGQVGNGRTRFDVMKDSCLAAVSSVDKAAVILFAATTKKLHNWEEFGIARFTVGATTNLEGALHRAAKMNPSHIVVITDGEPTGGGPRSNPKQASIDEARTMLARLDVYYCGNGASDAVAFCNELVQYGGQAVIDPQCLTMLESVKLFLCDSIATEGGAQ
jgi:Mg-chelatase subunit ChlD